MIRDQLLDRLAAMGDSPDYTRLAAEVLKLRVQDPVLARAIVEQALVVEDRQEAWQALGLRTVDRMPALPGVYVMRDRSGRALYVGKAANLRRRVASYFAPARWRALPASMTRAVAVDCEVVGSELEALLREADLIARLEPSVNVQIARHPRAGSSPLTPWPATAPRDVVVVQPSVEIDSAELICARVDGAWLQQRSRRNGADLFVHGARIGRFFGVGARRATPGSRGIGGRSGPGGPNDAPPAGAREADASEADAPATTLAPIVFGWLGGRGQGATRLHPSDCPTVRVLRARLLALLRDPVLFEDRIEQRSGGW